MFNYNHLYYFYITVKLKGVTRASRFLRTSQSSLSTQIKTLEENLGKKLFHKAGRGIELTPDGQAIFGFCREAFQVTDELSDFLKNSGQSKGRRLVIGVSDEIERPFMTDIIGHLLKRTDGTPQPMISMISSNHKEMQNKLEAGEIDVLISSQPIYASEIEVVSQIQMPIVLLGSSKLIGSSKNLDSTRIGAFLKSLDCGLVLPTADLRLRFEIDGFLQKLRVSKALVFESNVLASVSKAISESVGIGFLPLPYVFREVKQGSLLIIGSKDGLWKHKLYLLCPTKLQSHPLVIELKQHLELMSKLN
jgi:LysR family transcriptional activator of nhaA